MERKYIIIIFIIYLNYLSFLTSITTSTKCLRDYERFLHFCALRLMKIYAFNHRQQQDSILILPTYAINHGSRKLLRTLCENTLCFEIFDDANVRRPKYEMLLRRSVPCRVAIIPLKFFRHVYQFRDSKHVYKKVVT